MGRDKAHLVAGGKTLLQHIRRIAQQANYPVRVVKTDAVPRCGPIGGIYTGLRRSRASALLFLSCDMPFVSALLLTKVAGALSKRELAIFTAQPGGRRRRRGVTVGFPFVLRRAALPVIEGLLASGTYSLQELAKVLRAKRLRLPKPFEPQLFNINTPEDWETARMLWK